MTPRPLSGLNINDTRTRAGTNAGLCLVHSPETPLRISVAASQLCLGSEVSAQTASSLTNNVSRKDREEGCRTGGRDAAPHQPGATWSREQSLIDNNQL